MGTGDRREHLCPAAAKSDLHIFILVPVFPVLAIQCVRVSIHCAANSNGSPFPKLVAKARHRVRVWGVIRLAIALAIRVPVLFGKSQSPTPRRLILTALSGWSQAIGRINWGIPAARA